MGISSGVKSPHHFVLKEIEPGQHYLLQEKGARWEREFKNVAAAFFYARSIAKEGQSKMVVFNHHGQQATIFLF